MIWTSIRRGAVGVGLTISLIASHPALAANEPADVPMLTVQAEAGDPAAMVELGVHYFSAGGEGGFARAVALFRAAADKGYAPGMTWLGRAFEWGSTFAGSDSDENMDEAERWYRKAADAGDPDAMFTLGGLSERGAFRRVAPPTTEQFDLETREAVVWYRMAAQHGWAPAMRKLAELYEKGDGVPKDPVEAVRWYRLAAEAGDWEGMAVLSRMLEDGEGVGRDAAQANLWAERATAGWLQDLRMDASYGSTSAMIKIAQIYNQGHPGVPKDDAEAMRWYRMAADQGDRDAMWEMEKAYDEGRGVPRDPIEARRWEDKIIADRRAERIAMAEEGDITTLRDLALEALKGEDAAGQPTEKSPDEALRWLKLGAEKGDQWSMLMLSRLYAQDDFAGKDPVTANLWADRLAAIPAAERDPMIMTGDEMVARAAADHPAGYMLAAQRLALEGRADDAVFWYYVGQLRWRFERAARPAGDDAAFGAMLQVMGGPINEWAFGDLDGLLATLDRVLAWDEANENAFTSKADYPEEWRKAREGLVALQAEIRSNKAQIRRERKKHGLENRT